MYEHKPISDFPGVVTYRCETPHPTRKELSMFYTDSKATADGYKELGWTVTPLGRIEPITAKTNYFLYGVAIKVTLEHLMLLYERTATLEVVVNPDSVRTQKGTPVYTVEIAPAPKTAG